MSKHSSPGTSVEDRVFEAAKRLLGDRSDEMSEARAWVTGTEITSVTDIDKDEVLGALQRLGAQGRLHVKTAAAEGEIEVLGVEHDAGAESSVQHIDEE